jgi:hypothetical protein
MKKFFQTVWNIVIHVFWSVFIYGELLRSFDGILMNFGTRLHVAYASWNDSLMLSVLLSFLVISISASRSVVKLFREMIKRETQTQD